MVRCTSVTVIQVNTVRTVHTHFMFMLYGNSCIDMVPAWWVFRTLRTYYQRYSGCEDSKSVDRTWWSCEMVTSVTNLMPLDFFLWGALNDRVYQEVPTTWQNMQQCIIAAISIETKESVQRELVHRVLMQTVVTLNICCSDTVSSVQTLLVICECGSHAGCKLQT